MADENMQTLNFDFKTTGVTDATKKVEKLGTAFETLFTRMRALSKLDMKAVSSFSTRASTLAKSLGAISNINGNGLNAVMRALEKMPATVKSISGINTNNLHRFKTGMVDLAEALTPLNAIKSASGSVMNALSRLPQTMQALEGADYTSFGNNVEQVAEALSSLNGVNAPIGTTLNALGRLPEITQAIEGVDLGNFTKKCTELTAALSPLNANMNNIAEGFKGLKTTVPQVSRKVDEFVESNKKLKNESGSIKEVLGKIKTWWVAVAMAIKKAISGIGKSYNEFADYVEAINLYKVTMGSSASSEIDFAKEVESRLGIDIQDWMTTQGSMQQMMRGFGIQSQQATQMSRNLTQLAYDLSSVYNEDVSESAQKLSSAMTGQVKGIREYGIETTVAALQEFALSKGINKTVESMTMAEKAWLRYELIMEKTTNIQGDLGRTLLSPANSMRVLSNQVNILKRNLGAIVSVVATKIIPYFQIFIEYIADAAKAIADMFGVDVDDYFKSLGDVNLKYIEGLDDTEKKAESLKKTLMGFDEINTISDAKISNSSPEDASWVYEMGLYDYNILEQISEEIKEKADKIKEDLAEFGLDKIGDTIIQIFEALGKIWQTPIVQALVSSGLFSSLGGIDHVLGSVYDTLLLIEAILNFDIPNVLGFFLKTFYRTFLGVAHIIGSIGSIFTGGDNQMLRWVKGQIQRLNEADSLIDIFGVTEEEFGTAKKTTGVFFETTAKRFVDIIFTGLENLVKYRVPVLFEQMKLMILQIISDILNTLEESFPKLRFIQRISSSIDEAIEKTNNKIIKLEKEKEQRAIEFQDRENKRLEAYGEKIKDIFTEGSAFMQSSYTKALNEVGKKWKSTFTNVEATIQAAQGGDSFAKFLISTGGGVGYANGGYPDQGELFFANEAGPELVGTIGGRTAVASNNDILESMYRVMRDALSASNGGGGSTTVNLNLDGERVAQAVYNSHNNTVRQTGHSPLLV